MKYLTILFSIYLAIFVNNLDVNSSNNYINIDEIITTKSKNINFSCSNANILSNLRTCTYNLHEEVNGCRGYVEIGKSVGHGQGFTNFRYYGRGDCYGVEYRDNGSHARCPNVSDWIVAYLHYKIFVDLPGLPPYLHKRVDKTIYLYCLYNSCDDLP